MRHFSDDHWSDSMPENSRRRLIVFTRYPEPGTTKTRMIPQLGAEGAADLQRLMTEHIISKAKALCREHTIPVEVRYEGGSEELMSQWLGPGLSYCRQGDGDIGLRMGRALQNAFGQGCETAVIIGSDIPDITTDLVIRAFRTLNQKDLVLGPASDGGYYLIGVHRRSFRHWHPRIFRDINWGTEHVLLQTLKIADNLKLKYDLLHTLRDVDRPEDLSVWYDAAGRPPSQVSTKPISVIIPTLNEANSIEQTILNLNQHGPVEIIVVDGGSQDPTAAIAEAAGAEVMASEPSKARQMNAGAAGATGDILLFLHADTRLPDNYAEIVRTALKEDGIGAGAFSLGIESDADGLRLIEKVANWRSRVFQMPYGDQALFVSRSIFNQIGGFPDYPIMEDFEFVRRLKRVGKITILPDSVRTSPRRWQNLGIFKTWLLNQLIILLTTAVSLHNACQSGTIETKAHRNKQMPNPAEPEMNIDY